MNFTYLKRHYVFSYENFKSSLLVTLSFSDCGTDVVRVCLALGFRFYILSLASRCILFGFV